MEKKMENEMETEVTWHLLLWHDVVSALTGRFASPCLNLKPYSVNPKP